METPHLCEPGLTASDFTGCSCLNYPAYHIRFFRVSRNIVIYHQRADCTIVLMNLLVRPELFHQKSRNVWPTSPLPE